MNTPTPYQVHHWKPNTDGEKGITSHGLIDGIWEFSGESEEHFLIVASRNLLSKSHTWGDFQGCYIATITFPLDGYEEARANAKFIAEACNKYELFSAALKEIQLGRGAYSIDHLKHAANCIENSKRIATEALAGVYIIDEENK